MSAETLKAIAVTAELTNTFLSEAALEVMESDLAAYPEDQVLRALNRCRKELSGRLSPGAVIKMLSELDGRPSGDEAWAIAITSADESETVVWTDEMAKAWAIALPIYAERDKTGARVAFRDAYERLCRNARDNKVPPNWFVSQGWNPEKREHAVQMAVSSGYLTKGQANAYLPAPKDEGVVGRLLLGQVSTPEEIEAAPGVVSRCRLLLKGFKMKGVN